jgi:hypothetical protein
MNRITAHLQKLVLAGVTTALVAGAFLVIPSLTAFAAAAPQTANPPAAHTPQPDPTSRLETRFQKEQIWDTTQGKRIDLTNTLIGRAQGVIDRFKARGVDVAALQTALDNFKISTTSASAIHAKAGEILSTHAGFDANGKVIDQTAARATVQSAGESLQEARQTLNDAIPALRQEIRTFRQQHKPAAPVPTAPAPTAVPSNS